MPAFMVIIPKIQKEPCQNAFFFHGTFSNPLIMRSYLTDFHANTNEDWFDLAQKSDMNVIFITTDDFLVELVHAQNFSSILLHTSQKAQNTQ